MLPNRQDNPIPRSDDDPKLKYLARRAPYEDPPPAAPGCGFGLAILCLNLLFIGLPAILNAIEIGRGDSGDSGLMLLLLNPNPWAAAWFAKKKFPVHGTALAWVAFLVVAPLSTWLIYVIWFFLYLMIYGLPIG